MAYNEILIELNKNNTIGSYEKIRLRDTGLKYRVEQYTDGPIEGFHWQMIREFSLSQEGIIDARNCLQEYSKVQC